MNDFTHLPIFELVSHDNGFIEGDLNDFDIFLENNFYDKKDGAKHGN